MKRIEIAEITSVVIVALRHVTIIERMETAGKEATSGIGLEMMQNILGKAISDTLPAATRSLSTSTDTKTAQRCSTVYYPWQRDSIRHRPRQLLHPPSRPDHHQVRSHLRSPHLHQLTDMEVPYRHRRPLRCLLGSGTWDSNPDTTMGLPFFLRNNRRTTQYHLLQI
jgi:hypothetical protein